MALLWLSLLLLLAAPQGSRAVHYSITNQVATTPGGVPFEKEIGVNYTLQALMNSTNFVWMLFQQNTAADRKNFSNVSLFVENITDVTEFADTLNNEIHVSSNYIQSYTGDVKTEITGILFHEMTHVWQWHGNSSTPQGLIEGIADCVGLKTGYAPSHWAEPGQGDRWDQGYNVNARFLDYCNDLKDGIVAELNKKMRTSYSNCYLVGLLGKTPDQLFNDYKAKYKQG